jgi:hypothetical protein
MRSEVEKDEHSNEVLKLERSYNKIRKTNNIKNE